MDFLSGTCELAPRGQVLAS